jgi:ketopantoate hydroxymethyltransferase
MFGLYPRFKPRMAKVYGNAGEVILNGIIDYVSEVCGKSFPKPENYFSIKEDEYQELLKIID